MTKTKPIEVFTGSFMSSAKENKELEPIEFWVTLTQAELRSFDGLHYDFPLHVYIVLREHMDGETRTVTSEWKRLCKKLVAKAVPGSKEHRGGEPTPRKVQCAVDVLIERGLVERISKNRTLILLLPKAPSKHQIEERKKILASRGTSEERQTMSVRPQPLKTLGSNQIGTLDAGDGSSVRYSNNQSLPPESNLNIQTSLPLDTYTRARGKTFEDLKLCDPLWEEFLGMYPRLDDVDRAEKLWRVEKLWKYWPEILADLSVRKWPAQTHWIPTVFNYLLRKKWKDQTKGERVNEQSARATVTQAVAGLFTEDS
jgi:hypothetical protein